MTANAYDTCPASTVGDLQLEIALTPLLFNRQPIQVLVSHTPHDTLPDISILDVGCGAARLAGALQGFPNHILQHIRYTGCEPSDERAAEARSEIVRLSDDPSFAPLRDVLMTASVHTWDQIRQQSEGQYDIAYVVNVLHHIPATQLPSFLMNVVAAVKDGGFVVLHDFYIGPDPAGLDADKYCPSSVFFSPDHFSAMFCMASTQTGVFRTVRRRSGKGKHFDVFSLVLHVENELAAQQPWESFGDDDYMSYLDIYPALEACFRHHTRETHSWNASPWADAYRVVVERAHVDFRSEWPYPSDWLVPFVLAERWLGVPQWPDPAAELDS